MATEPKTLPAHIASNSAELRRIGRLAEKPGLIAAQRWFVRERASINETHLQICRVPAPTFFEQQRAEWFRLRLAELGWYARLDRAGNVLASLPDSHSFPRAVVSAHLDTVYAPGRPDEISYQSDGRLVGPGVSDNGSGLSALLALARLLIENQDLHDLAENLLLVANVGEEGEGNLSGMRYLCRQGAELSEIAAFVVLDGPSTDHITAQALASRRFEVTFSGPGGHSWNDWGVPNPVHALGDLVSNYVQAADAKVGADRKNRSSYNFGVVEGGTSINSIPSSASAKLDLRSEHPSALEELSGLLTASVERTLERENRRSKDGRVSARIKELGSRPGGKLPDNSALLRAIQSVDSLLNIRSRINCASTDANIPLSMGLPAISIGAGGRGGGAHTPAEWYRPDGRETGLKRILLLLAYMHSEMSE